MDIGIAVHNYDPSEGTGGYVVELLPRIAAKHEVTLYAARVLASVPHGVRVIRVPALMSRAYTAILSFPAALQAVRRQHDIFHAQGWVATSADIVTAHIVLAGWRKAAKAAAVPTPPGERLLGGFVEKWEAKLIGRNAQHVIAPSNQAKRDIEALYGRTGRTTVIPHGFPRPADFADHSAKRTAARKTLGLPNATCALYVGDPRKGLSAAMKAVADTQTVHLAVVSHSPPDAHARLIGELGIEQRVHWIGKLDDPSIAYEATDLLLHPTVYDSFGLVVAEAMSFGLPVVTSDCAGISELIDHRVSGWIVRGDLAVETSNALAELSCNGGLRASMGRAAASVAASHSWYRVAEETLTVYEETVDR